MLPSELLNQANTLQQAITNSNSAFNAECNNVLFQAITGAQFDAVTNTMDAPPHLIELPTGSGKTTFCVSFIVAAYKLIPGYSAAYIVATIDEAQKIYHALSPFIPDASLGIYTSRHASQHASETHNDSVRDHVRHKGTSNRTCLINKQVIICTHELWLLEVEGPQKLGVQHFNSARRSNVFLDEFPSSITTNIVVPSDLNELADELGRIAEYRDIASVVHCAAATFRAQCRDDNRRFKTASLLSAADHAALKRIDLSRLSDTHDMARLRRIFDALCATSTGQCFLSRSKAKAAAQPDGQMMLVAYTDRFRSHPGLVILDATADFAAQVQAEHDFHRYSGPPVSYRNLTMTHIQQPKAFATIASRAASAETIRAYVQWIKDTVKANTTKDDSILIVVPKKVAASLTVDNPVPGRAVMVATWGMGVGSNAYRDCGTVFLFSEFHKPRHSYLAESLASRSKKATDDDLRQAMGSKCTGAVYTTISGHLLRQFKQMSCRGRIRQLDAAGVASPMRLFTSMDRALFLDSYPSLFPDAPPPTLYPSAGDRRALTGAVGADCPYGRP